MALKNQQQTSKIAPQSSALAVFSHEACLNTAQKNELFSAAVFSYLAPLRLFKLSV
jgi:hypothetical protein